MKNERCYPVWQYGGSSVHNQDTSTPRARSRAASPLTPSPVSAVSMGLQPLTHATSPLSHLATCVPSQNGNQHCHCALIHTPQHRTILHGILTGQGYKYGYGGNFAGPLFRDPSGYDDHDSLCTQLDSLDNTSLVHSREVTSPSRYIIQPVAK